MALNSSGDYDDAFFRPRAADFVTSTRTLTPAEFVLSPNPARAGQHFTLQSDRDLNQGYLQLLSAAGRVIQTFPLSGNGGSTYTLPLPKQLKPGLYLLQAFDQEGQIYQAERLIVHYDLCSAHCCTSWTFLKSPRKIIKGEYLILLANGFFCGG